MPAESFCWLNAKSRPLSSAGMPKGKSTDQLTNHPPAVISTAKATPEKGERNARCMPVQGLLRSALQSCRAKLPAEDITPVRSSIPRGISNHRQTAHHAMQPAMVQLKQPQHNNQADFLSFSPSFLFFFFPPFLSRYRPARHTAV